MNTETTLEATSDGEPNVYDVVPYESFPYDFTVPERLHAVGRLFGMAPPDFLTARVLELGCAGGGNLVPMAARYPKADFIGVDLSAVEIGLARDLAAAAETSNVEFRHLSIADIGADLGLFDYIICHGVLSWVPPPVQEAIFRVCFENLTPQGVALVSYNTLPGWNMVRSVREMMMYHCERFPPDQEKIDQGVALLRFVLDGLGPAQGAWREVVENELDTLTKGDPTYVLHDHFEGINQPFYLHEVAAAARAAGLEYLGDTNLDIMYMHNFPEQVAKTLAAADDTVRIEQYLDFITNRRFRVSLFCHPGIPLRRQLDGEAIMDFHLASRLQTPAPSPIELAYDVPTVFPMENGREVTANHRFAAALLLDLCESGGRARPARVVIRAAVDRLAPKRREAAQTQAKVRQALVELGLQLVFAGGLTLHSDSPPDVAEVSTRPLAFAPARALASRGNAWAPNARHRRINLTGPGERALLALCDGGRNRAQLAAAMLERVATGELTVNRDGRPLADPDEQKGEVARWTDDMLGQFARHALLVK